MQGLIRARSPTAILFIKQVCRDATSLEDRLSRRTGGLDFMIDRCCYYYSAGASWMHLSVAFERRGGHRRAERSDKRRQEPFMSFLSSDFMRYVSYRWWILLLCRAIRSRFTAVPRIRRISTLPSAPRSLLSFPFDLSSGAHPCNSCPAVSRCKHAFIGTGLKPSGSVSLDCTRIHFADATVKGLYALSKFTMCSLIS